LSQTESSTEEVKIEGDEVIPGIRTTITTKSQTDSSREEAKIQGEDILDIQTIITIKEEETKTEMRIATNTHQIDNTDEGSSLIDYVY
jgi:hypothetical protein